MSPRDVSRRDVTKALGVGGIAALAGCGGNSNSGGGSSNSSETTTSASGSGSNGKFAMVYTTEGKGDNGFNDQAYAGVKEARKQLGVTVTEATPSGPDQYLTLFKKFSQKDYDLIISLSSDASTAMKQAAQSYPKQEFAIADYSITGVPNIASYVFAQRQACYLAGQLAAMLTTKTNFNAGSGSINSKKTVGFLGGKKVPVIAHFQAGYEAGVNSIDSNTNVLVNYAGSWSAPQKGQSIAESMYNNGADIVFPAAGNTGTGVFKAAQSMKKYGIGVDKKQSVALPNYADVILGSVVKRVDSAVLHSIKSVLHGSFSAKVHTLDLAANGVDFAYGAKLGSAIPSDIKNQLDDSRKKIANGSITVPKQPQQ